MRQGKGRLGAYPLLYVAVRKGNGIMGGRWKRELPLHFMILPGLLLILVFSYIPMAGIVIAFQKFIPAKGLFGDQKWIGWDNFNYVMDLPSFQQVFWNTLSIASMKLVL